MPMLNVPYIKQFNTHACFAAGTAMVLRYHGIPINQQQIYKNAKIYTTDGKQIVGCSETKVAEVLSNQKLALEWWIDWKKTKMPNELKEWFKKYKNEIKILIKKGQIIQRKNATIALIKKRIDEGRPVMTEIHWNTWRHTKRFKDYETHIVVIVGYDAKNVYVHDPYYPYLGKKGAYVKTSYTRFEKAWKSPQPFQNVLFDVRPIAQETIR